MMEPTLDLSVVVPVFNEQEIIDEYYRRATEAFASLGLSYEIVFIDDGSRDNTLTRLLDFQKKDARVKVLEFSRNFGHQSAMTAGLHHAAGRACVVMDADLQDPPELIKDLLGKWKEGYDVVYAVRRKREGEGLVKRLTAKMFYRVLHALSGVDIPMDTGDFRLMDRRVVEAFNSLPERNRFIRGLVSWIGFKQVGVAFDRPARTAGETKFPFYKMLRFAFDGITSFSRLPLRLVTLAGFGCFVLSFGVMGWVFYVRFVAHTEIQGWTSLIGVVLFLGSIQLLSLGIIGEYISRIFDESKQRPLYFVRRRHGF